MKPLHNYYKFKKLRKQYPFFCFQSYSIEASEQFLNIKFLFNLSDTYFFTPMMTFPLKYPISYQELSDIENFAFHIGMIELISYWKSTCSPKIIIKPFFLNEEQIQWWKKLYFNGLAEFFYYNSIKTDMHTFVNIEIDSEIEIQMTKSKFHDSIIIPIGGGKDSIVTLELLKQTNCKIIPLFLNTNIARNKTISNAGYDLKECIEIQREIHPGLLNLNNKGYLNGHTPFSSLLAFSTILAAYLHNCKHIALSNESSANEATIPNTKINHQYSKSFEFESDFRYYVKKYISADINYFSFLRPLNELQIAKIFSKFENHYFDFRSCNVGSKTNSWCGNCPKCLFTYIILSPFIEKSVLQQIFKNDLLQNRALNQILKELSGFSFAKPFDCVGSKDDVNIALQLRVKNTEVENLPILLSDYLKEKNYFNIPKNKIDNHLKSLDPGHFLEKTFLSIIKQYVS